MSYIGFPICSLVFMTILIIIFLTKKNVVRTENKLFTGLLILNIIGLILEILCFVSVKNLDTNYYLWMFVLKTFVVYIFTWVMLFNIYVFLITNKDYFNKDFDKSSSVKKYMKIFSIPYILYIILAYILKLNIFNEGLKLYTYGEAIDIMVICFVLLIFVWIIRLVYRLNKSNQKITKQYILIIMAIIFIGGIGAAVQILDKSVLIITAMHSAVMLIMYFTIENPDTKLIKELEYSKEVAQKSNKATISTLDHIYNFLKSDLQKLEEYGNEKIKIEDFEEAKKNIRHIQKFSLKLADTIYRTIDLAKLDNEDIEIVYQKYDTYEMLEEIKNLINTKKGTKKITVNIECNDNIKKVLFGDPDRIKQLVLYMFGHIMEIVKVGTINIKIDSMNVGRFCKLSFCFNYNISDISTYDKETENLNTKIINKLINLLDGSYLERINEDFINITFSVNNRILPEYDIYELPESIKKTKIEHFDLNEKRVLIVDNNNSKIRDLSRILKQYKLKIDSATDDKELEKALFSNKIYDLIIVDDIMPPSDTESEYFINRFSDYSKYISKFSGYDIPLVILTTPNNNKYEENYLKMGFDYYILKPIDKVKINQMLKYIFKK